MHITLPSTRTVKLISGENPLNRNEPRPYTEETQTVKNLNTFKEKEKGKKLSKKVKKKMEVKQKGK